MPFKPILFYMPALAATTAIFFYHSYTIISRFLKFEILELHEVIYNESLPMPLVAIYLESWRNANSSSPFAEMRNEAYLNRKPVPSWAIVESHDRYPGYLRDSFKLNVVSADNYEYAKQLL